ncbi:MAG: AmmeMemoRadiSam system protein A [Shewanella sp.]|nr:AmmeMemoRadiSam system protein A [Shewanella sp.]MCF1432157.1 AmmeMemoRadiSam system protein A [Shewanella sp.]MCF1458312.1 AmmeMemoRadiSam system protein A [Shewanella sp.]
MSSVKYSQCELSQLLSVARMAIASHFGENAALLPNVADYDEHLRAPVGCFVTLEVSGQLQGCIGTIHSQQPLVQEVHQKALSAAFHDRRFPPLTAAQLPELTLEVSVLSRPVRLTTGTELDCLNHLDRHRPGVILSHEQHCGVFLPQVWDKLKEPREFITALKRKAGIDPNLPTTDMRVELFTVDKHKEPYCQS